MAGADKLLAWLVVVALLAGCASGPVAFPDKAQSVVRVLPYSDVPGHNLRTSHVRVRWPQEAARNATVGNIAGMVGGGVGAAVALMVGALMTTGKSEKVSMEELERALAVRYDELVSERLRAAGGINLAGANQPANVTLVPTATLMIFDTGNALECMLEVRFSVGGPVSVFTHRTYTYVAPQRSIGGPGGWIENDGIAFREETNRAFRAIADAFAADWNAIPAEASRTVRWQRPGMPTARSAKLVRELPDFVVLVGGTVESPNASQLVIIERSALLP